MTADPDDRSSEPGRSLSTDELEERLASASLGAGDPTGWFEALYAAGESGQVTVPWSRLGAHPLLVGWTGEHRLDSRGRRAVVVGCELGADAEYVSSLGYATTAFDVSATAIRLARHRHLSSGVDYRTADLLDPPAAWSRSFDLVVEVITVQALPDPPRRQAIVTVGRLVTPGGTLLAIAAAQRAGAPSSAGPSLRRRRRRTRDRSVRPMLSDLFLPIFDQIPTRPLSLASPPRQGTAWSGSEPDARRRRPSTTDSCTADRL